MAEEKRITYQTIRRLPGYYTLLKRLEEEGQPTVSAKAIATLTSQTEIQVRKDLASVGRGGKPRTGFQVRALIADIGSVLGYDNINDAVLVGVGHLGRALLCYQGFEEYGLNIVAGFDADPDLSGIRVGGKPVLPLEKLDSFCRRTSTHIGIITVPGCHAQSVCDRMVQNGILAIWNFAPVHLEVPGDILVEHENIAASLSLLSQNLARKMREEGQP